MGVDTKLKINVKWSVDEIVTALEKHVGVKNIKILFPTKVTTQMYQILFDSREGNGGQRNIFLHLAYSDLGDVHHLLSLGAWGEGPEILKKLGKVFGGWYQASDCESAWDELDGIFSDHSGLSYFLKYALVNNEMTNRSIPKLQESIKNWVTKVNADSNIDFIK